MRPTLPTIALTFGLAAAAHAQGTVPGARSGARDGAAIAGPVGEIVGGAVGAAVGTVGGILGVDASQRLREAILREDRPSYRSDEPVRVGTVLPAAGVTYYEVPDAYVGTGYRYTVVNGLPVIVDPATRRIVEVIE